MNVPYVSSSSSTEESSDDEMAPEIEALVQQAQQIQETLRSRNQQVENLNQPTLQALENMNYLQGVEARVQTLTTGSQGVSEFQRNISAPLSRAEMAIISRQKELQGLQAQINNLRHQVGRAPNSPFLNDAIELGKRVSQYISNKNS